MSKDRFIKDISDTRRITGDWSLFLGATALINSVVYTVPAALTAANDSIAADGLTETNFYSGGVNQTEYTIKATITTDESPPRVKSHSILLAVEANC